MAEEHKKPEPSAPPCDPPMAEIIQTAQLPQAAPITLLQKISVLSGASKVIQDPENNKEFRSYSYTIEAIQQQPSFSCEFRFSRLRDVHVEFGEIEGLPSFPSRKPFADHTTNESNCQIRHEELRQYLERLLNMQDNGCVIGDQRLHIVLGLDGRGAEALNYHADARRRAHEATLERERAIRAAQAKQALDDAALAQRFHTMGEGGALTTLVFPRQQHFVLQNKFWGFGDATIRGQDDHPWFQMVRTNASMFGDLFRDAHFVIANMAGEAIIVMQERFRWMNYEYDLFRIDPVTRQLVPFVRVVRHWTLTLFSELYTIDIQFGPMAGTQMETVGRWPNDCHLDFGDTRAAYVKKKLFTLRDTYDLFISPGMDIVMFLGIACAIDRIHHEVQERRRR